MGPPANFQDTRKMPPTYLHSAVLIRVHICRKPLDILSSDSCTCDLSAATPFTPLFPILWREREREREREAPANERGGGREGLLMSIHEYSLSLTSGERGREGGRERGRERERLCVYVFICIQSLSLSKSSVLYIHSLSLLQVFSSS